MVFVSSFTMYCISGCTHQNINPPFSEVYRITGIKRMPAFGIGEQTVSIEVNSLSKKLQGSIVKLRVPFYSLPVPREQRNTEQGTDELGGAILHHAPVPCLSVQYYFPVSKLSIEISGSCKLPEKDLK